jgi:hypothetical protein
MPGSTVRDFVDEYDCKPVAVARDQREDFDKYCSREALFFCSDLWKFIV